MNTKSAKVTVEDGTENWRSWPLQPGGQATGPQFPRPNRVYLSVPLREEPPDAADRSDAEMREQIRAYIRAYLTSSCLDSSMLLRAFRISRSALYRLFADVGGVARYIREQRIEAAHKRIAQDPCGSLSRLLYDLGFSNDRQFQRAFRARYGMSPTYMRQQLMRLDSGSTSSDD